MLHHYTTIFAMMMVVLIPAIRAGIEPQSKEDALKIFNRLLGCIYTISYDWCETSQRKIEVIESQTVIAMGSFRVKGRVSDGKKMFAATMAILLAAISAKIDSRNAEYVALNTFKGMFSCGFNAFYDRCEKPQRKTEIFPLAIGTFYGKERETYFVRARVSDGTKTKTCVMHFRKTLVPPKEELSFSCE